MTDISCPVDGCDYTAETVDSVEGHINAKSDPDHADKPALRGAIEAPSPGDDADDRANDHPETDPQQADDDHPEGTSDQGTEAGGSITMSDDTEVNDQWHDTDDQPETEAQQADDDQADDPPATTSPGTPSGGGLPVPVDATTLLVGVVMLAFGVVVWRYATADANDHPEPEGGQVDATTSETTPSEGGDAGGSEARPDDATEAAGGLIE